ncbi:MAG: PAS domain-containing sensor histidine kinase, partial [Anaerolineae bacterium]|nr:PAS domain-containing sensor histidine kinase [Anaerolineae bacterium]
PDSVIREQQTYFDRIPLLRQFADSVPIIFLILNPQRQIVFVNRAITGLLGASNERAMYGQRPGELLDCEHATESEGGCGTTTFCRMCGAARAILSGLDGVEDVQECRITTRSGGAFDFRVWTTPYQVEGATFALFTLQDTGGDKRRRALERIFFHDILNNVSAIMGFSTFLQTVMEREQPAINGRIHELTGTITLLSQQLAEEVKAQRQLSAAESNELTVQWDRVDALVMVQQVAAMYEQFSVSDGRQIVIDPRAEAVRFTTDPALLRRVLGNMLKNALEAVRRGNTVTMHCYADEGVSGDEVVFTVHNPGHMPPDTQLQIFQRSFSTKGDGRGLGTYSMRLLTERYLQGRVEFTSSPEAGTVFRVHYPVLPDGVE